MSFTPNYRMKSQKWIENRVKPIFHYFPSYVTPNMLSFGNFMSIMIASISIYFQMYLIAFIGLLFAFTLDNFDGMLSRFRNQDSAKGYYIDSSFDRIGDAVWFIAVYLMFPSLQFSILILAISAFLINYFRSQHLLVYNISKPGLFEKSERNIVFLIFLFLLVVNIDFVVIKFLFNTMVILSVLTVLQLVIRGLILSRNSPVSDILDKLDQKLAGT